MHREVFSDLLFVGLSNVAATHQSPHNPTDAKEYRVASSLAAAARFIKSVLAVDDDEARARIKEIAAHCKTLLGDEDDDLIEREDAEDDPEVKQALIELRTLVAQVSELRA